MIWDNFEFELKHCVDKEAIYCIVNVVLNLKVNCENCVEAETLTFHPLFLCVPTHTPVNGVNLWLVLSRLYTTIA